MEGLEVLASAFVTKYEASKVTEAREGSLDDVPKHAKPAAVDRVGARGRQALDPQASNVRDHFFGAVRAIADDRTRVAARAAARATHRRPRVERRGQYNLIRHVGRRGLHDQRVAPGVAQNVALAALFAASCRIRPGVLPPFKARTDCESTTAC